MNKPFKVGVIGVSHNHAWHILDTLQKSGLGTLVAAAVEDKSGLESRRERIRKEYGVEKLYTDYRDMLGNEDIDVVFNYTDHILRAPTVELAASKGLPSLVEKPMAYSLADAERMLKAAEENGVQLMVNWPTAWSPAYRKAVQLIEEGAIGDLFHVRGRFGHSGPQKETFGEFYDFLWMGTEAAGGAYMDFCCYGAALTLGTMGMPKRVFAVIGNFMKPFFEGPDNGILVMMYERGTATIEGTWTQTGRVPGGPVFYGTEGSIALGETPIIYTNDRRDGEAIPVDPLPNGESNVVEYFLTSIAEDRPISGMCDPKFARDVQEVLEAGLISSHIDKPIAIPLSNG